MNHRPLFRLLHQAALWDNAELLEDLLNGDEIKCLDSRDSWGRTALHAAATNPGARCLRILAQAGADLDACMGPRGEGMCNIISSQFLLPATDFLQFIYAIAVIAIILHR